MNIALINSTDSVSIEYRKAISLYVNKIAANTDQFNIQNIKFDLYALGASLLHTSIYMEQLGNAITGLTELANKILSESLLAVDGGKIKKPRGCKKSGGESHQTSSLLSTIPSTIPKKSEMPNLLKNVLSDDLPKILETNFNKVSSFKIRYVGRTS